MDLGLSGKVALVCGGSRGLGYATAERLAQEGARVAILARNPQQLEQAARTLRQDTQGEILTLEADVADEDQSHAAFERLSKQWGAPELLLLNAGGPPSGRFDALTDDDWRRAFEVTVMSSIRFVRWALPAMIERRAGCLLFLTSLAVRQPLQAMILSNSLRAAVTNMAKSLADEVAGTGVRINTLAPGYILTSRTEAVLQAQAADRGIPVEMHMTSVETRAPLKRIGWPSEFGDVACFMLSERSSYLHGQQVVLDGGMCRCV